MGTLTIVLLSIGAILLVCGIIRVIMTPSTSFGNFMLEVFMLDLMYDLLVGIFEIIFEGIDDL